MFGFGMPELVIILVLVLVVMGPGKLPQMGQALGSSIRNFKKASVGDDETAKVINRQADAERS
jgi:sec-independent protein translocase protein TatA